ANPTACCKHRKRRRVPVELRREQSLSRVAGPAPSTLGHPCRVPTPTGNRDRWSEHKSDHRASTGAFRALRPAAESASAPCSARAALAPDSSDKPAPREPDAPGEQDPRRWPVPPPPSWPRQRTPPPRPRPWPTRRRDAPPPGDAGATRALVMVV